VRAKIAKMAAQVAQGPAAHARRATEAAPSDAWGESFLDAKDVAVARRLQQALAGASAPPAPRLKQLAEFAAAFLETRVRGLAASPPRCARAGRGTDAATRPQSLSAEAAETLRGDATLMAVFVGVLALLGAARRNRVAPADLAPALRALQFPAPFAHEMQTLWAAR
jgi:hypothetical protein